jgi:hypothetical protein
MARRKGRLSDDAPYLELARALGTLRRRARLTYQSMAALVAGPGCSATTLSRADRGERLPRREVAIAFGRACGATAGELLVLTEIWERAAASRPNGVRATGATAQVTGFRRRRKLELIYEPAHLLIAIHQVRLAAGQPSLRELERRARRMGVGSLPKSTMSDVLAGIRLPTEGHLLTFLRCCGESEFSLERWRDVHRRVSRHGEDATDPIGPVRTTDYRSFDRAPQRRTRRGPSGIAAPRIRPDERLTG